jgi:DNA-binding NtrC family response regulator
MVDTTIPRDATADARNPVPSWVFVLCWSSSQPDRAGEVAFLTAFEHVFLGRGDEKVHEFAAFGQHRPGKPVPTGSPEAFLAGQGLSRRQLRVRATAVGVEVEVVGRLATFVNGGEKEVSRATLRDGDTLYLRGELVLLCTQRQRTLPGTGVLHTFGQPDAHGIVGEGPKAWGLRVQLAKAAASDLHVLILGESGSGKELAAATIHEGSGRAKGPYVDRNASSFSPDLIDAELFGNLKNFPNPGQPARDGIVGEADGGTLFLDEIGDLPLDVQTRLLRFMDDGRFNAVGEATTREADVRVLGATNKGESAFRPDFLARFPDTVPIPPLRERREDTPLLIRHCLLRLAHKHASAKRFCPVGRSGGMEPRISGRLVDYLVRQELPRNVRDLEAFLVLAAKQSEDAGYEELTLPTSIRSSTTTPPPEPGANEVAREPTKKELLAALKREGENLSAVARSFGIGRNPLYRLLEQYGIEIKKAETEP